MVENGVVSIAILLALFALCMIVTYLDDDETMRR